MNNKMAFLFTFLVLTMQHGVVLIKGIPGCPPTRICEINGCDDIVANANNLPFLISMLRNNRVESAAVGGWNDHLSYDLVLRSNGALAPFSGLTNNAHHAFCIPKGRGCNRERQAPIQQTHMQKKPVCVKVVCKEPAVFVPTVCEPPAVNSPILCKPESTQSSVAPQIPCPPVEHKPTPQPEHCETQVAIPIKEHHVYIQPQRLDCRSETRRNKSKLPVCSSSSTEQSCTSNDSDSSCDLCPKYVKQRNIVYKNKGKHDKCKPRVCGALENIKLVKTFVFKSCDITNKKKVKFCEVTNEATELIKWVELRPSFDGKSLTKDGYPTILRFPIFLYEFKKYIACKYMYKNPCLYLDCCGKLYVRIKDTLFLVKFKSQIKSSRKHGFKDIKLCSVKGKKLNELIQSGLAGVVFEDGKLDC